MALSVIGATEGSFSRRTVVPAVMNNEHTHRARKRDLDEAERQWQQITTSSVVVPCTQSTHHARYLDLKDSKDSSNRLESLVRQASQRYDKRETGPHSSLCPTACQEKPSLRARTYRNRFSIISVR